MAALTAVAIDPEEAPALRGNCLYALSFIAQTVEGKAALKKARWLVSEASLVCCTFVELHTTVVLRLHSLETSLNCSRK